MILQGRPCGKVGRRHIILKTPPIERWGAFLLDIRVLDTYLPENLLPGRDNVLHASKRDGTNWAVEKTVF